MKDFNTLVKEQRIATAVKNKIVYKIFEAIQMQTLDLSDQYTVYIKTNKYSNGISIVLEDFYSHTKYTIEVSKED